MRPTLHLIGLPHTQTIREHVVCAFTAKLVKFAEMMADRGWPVIVYSGEHNEAPCVEHVPLFTDREQRDWYGNLDPNVLPTVAKFDATETPWRQMNARATAEILRRKQPHDIVLILGGVAQRPVADAMPEMLSCEWAAGYSGIFSPHVCFESVAWRHYLYGKLALGEGRWFDTVIPNFFRPDDFQLADQKGDYLLFVGRTIQQKGILVAWEIARRCGRRLIVAGSGMAEHRVGYMRTFDGCELTGDVEYVGPVDANTRNGLMRHAYALLCPTTYIEPFGAVAVEAQLCGTPAIATDWGAFTETVAEHLRFRTLAGGVRAVERAADELPGTVRANALERYSLDACAPLYEEWFDRLSLLWKDGWYTSDDRSTLLPV